MENRLQFSSKLAPRANIGDVYEMTVSVSADGILTIYTNGDKAPQYKYALKDAAHVTQWEVADQAAATRKQANTYQTRERSQYLTAHLDGLRSAFQKLPYAQRRAFLAFVMNYLLKGAE